MKYNLFTLKTRNRIKKLLGKTKTKKRELQIDHSDTLLTQIKKIDKKVLDGVVLEYKFNPCRKGFYANNKKTQRLSQDLEQPLLELAECYWEGFQKYPKNDWEKRSVEHHIEHIEAHIQGYKKDINNTDERYNLIHAACRLMMINAKFHYRDKNLFFRSL